MVFQTVEYDPMCDKDNPQKITFEDVSAAAFRIQNGIVKTPCIKSHMSLIFGMDIYLKNDFLQHTGSFKERGARNALLLLSPEAKRRGIISASLGNHSQALSYHANHLKVPVTVVMPNVAPIMKIQKCRSYGADVVIHGHDMKEAKYHAMTLAKERELTYINGYDHPHIMAGQGTVGLEILEQVPDVDAVLVPVGGGGLLAGVVTAIKHLKPEVLIYGVESEKCPSMTLALQNEKPVSVEIRSTLADGLAVPTVGYNAYVTAQPTMVKMISVNEDWIARAILHLVEQEKCVVEGGGAVGVAAIMAGLVPELAGKKVVCILSGGNIDTTILGRCLERGLAAEQRLVKFKVTVSDRPGGIAELCKLIASIGVSIKDIMQERAWVFGDIFSVRDVEYDENCDPNNPRKIKYDDILAASRRIVGSVRKTPCTRAHMSDKLGMELYLKPEFLQHTGSFKERGVRNTLLLLTEEQRRYGVISASTGNHGLAMSYHTTQMGIPCVIVMPIYAPITKSTRCEMFGAKTILFGANIAEAKHHAMTISKEKKMTYVNGFDHPNVIEGQGSMGIEIVEQVPEVDAVLVPVGGGSMITGVAIAVKHLKPDTEIYGIQTEKTCSMVEALRKNERVKITIDSTIADGLAVPLVGVNTFHSLKGVIDKMVVVKEDWVARAIMHIVEEERFVVEGAGAVCIAAVMAGLFPNLKGKKVVAILSGGNIDTTVLARSLERGMAAEGRLVKFKVTVSDRPGGMAELCSSLASLGVTLRDCIPERAWVKGDIFSVEMKIIAETRGMDHAKELVEMIKKNYKEYFFQELSDQRQNKGPGAKRGPCLAPNPVCMQK